MRVIHLLFVLLLANTKNIPHLNAAFKVVNVLGCLGVQVIGGFSGFFILLQLDIKQKVDAVLEIVLDKETIIKNPSRTINSTDTNAAEMQVVQIALAQKGEIGPTNHRSCPYPTV